MVSPMWTLGPLEAHSLPACPTLPVPTTGKEERGKPAGAPVFTAG